MTPQSEIQNRIQRTRQAMHEKRIPALLVTRLTNVHWLSGFTGSNGFVLLTDNLALFATDSRYTTQAAAECPAYERVKLESSAPEEIAGILQRSGTARIGFEEDDLTFRLHSVYKANLPPTVEMVPTYRVVDDLRMVKSPWEVARIEEACGIVDRAFAHILNVIRPGITERDVMLELEWFIRKTEGAEISFETILASGPRSALPHGHATDRVLKHGDFVTMDFGALKAGYCSDITRTVVLGPPSAFHKEIYCIVHKALDRAIAGAVNGASCKTVDALARDHIRERGYGNYFGHGLGHSLGMDVHDGPGFSSRSETVLEPGMVLTVEPGIYVPEKGGARVENDIVITEGPARVLTTAPTELISL